MALDSVGLSGDGPLARVYALLEIPHFLRFRGLVADEIINAGGAPQPLVIIAVSAQRTFDDAHRLFVARGVVAEGEEIVGLLIRVRVGRSRYVFGLRLRKDGRKEAANGQSQKYRYFHPTKTNNTSRVSQVAAAATERQGDKGTRGQGDKENLIFPSPCLPVATSLTDAASEFAKSRPIVKNTVFFQSEENEHEQVLRYNADILRQLASASRPLLHDSGRRHGGALQAAARLRDLLFDRDR